MYNRQYFNNFIETWNPIKRKAEKGIQQDQKFSADSFIKIFGAANATNITGQDDELILIAFLKHCSSTRHRFSAIVIPTAWLPNF